MRLLFSTLEMPWRHSSKTTSDCTTWPHQGQSLSETLQRREDDLRDAQLLLLRLEKDTNGITALLHDEVERREKHQLRVRKLAESGNISANQVADAEFCVLRARLSSPGKRTIRN
jgi:hypothetical protein